LEPGVNNKSKHKNAATWMLFSLFAALVYIACYSHTAGAETQQYCVACKDPEQTYICQVETPHSNPSDKGMQLYCIIKTSKDGGHSSCTVLANKTENCSGSIKKFTFQAPAIPSEVKSAVDRFRNSNQTKPDEQLIPPQKGDEPKTLIDMTGRAVKASRKGLSNTGQAVSGAASSTTGKAGKAARGVGKGVKKAAGKVGSVTKKSGRAVGGAAKTAFDCIKYFFKECGSKKTDEPSVTR
jgi:hypothetical protein